MPTTYFQRSTASGLSAGGTYNLQLLETTAAEVARVVSLGGGATATGHHFTEPGIPGADGVTGNYSVEVDIAVGDSNVMVSAQVARVNSSGTVQNQSAFTAEQTSTGAVLTFNFSSPNLGTWAAGDRLRVSVRYRNSHTHASREVSVGLNTADSAVTAPWTAAAPVSTVTGTATTDVAATGTLSVPTATVPTVTGTATTDIAATGTLSVPTTGVPTVSGTASTDIAGSGTLSVPSVAAGETPVVESVTTTTPVDGLAPTFNMPATRPDGDLYVLYAGSDDNESIVAPSGWTTSQARVDSAGNTSYMLVAWRIGDSEPATYTLGTPEGEMDGQTVVIRVSGVDTTEPINQSAISADAFTGAIAPSVTPDVANTLVLRLFHSDGAAFDTLPSGTQLYLDQTDPPFAGVSEDGPASGSPTGTATALLTASDEWIAATVAIAPVAGESVPTVSGTASTDVAASGSLSVPTATVPTVSGSATTGVSASGVLSVPAATVAAVAGAAVTAVAILGALSVPVASVPAATGTATTSIAASGSVSAPAATVSTVTGTATTDVAGSGVLSVPTAAAPTVTGTATTDIAASGSLSVPTATVPNVTGTATTDISATGTVTGNPWSAFLTDTFTDTDLTPLYEHSPDIGGSWEELPFTTSEMEPGPVDPADPESATTDYFAALVYEDQLITRSDNERTPTYRNTADPGSDEFDITLTWQFGDGNIGQFHWLCWRMSPTGTADDEVDRYMLIGDNNASVWELFKTVGGSPTGRTLLDSQAASLSNTTVDVRVEVRTDGMTVYADDTPILSSSDTEITQRGRIGIGTANGHPGHSTDNLNAEAPPPATSVSGTATTNVAMSGALSVPTATVDAVTGTATTDVAVSGTLSVPTATVATVSGTATTNIGASGTLSVPIAAVDTVTGTATTDVSVSGNLSVPTATVPTATGTATTDVAGSGALFVPTATVPTVSGTATTDIAVSGALSHPTDIPSVTGTVVTDISGTGTLSVPTATVSDITGTAVTDVAVSGALLVPTATVDSVSGTAVTDIAASGSLSVPIATVSAVTGTATTDIAGSGTLLVPTATVDSVTGSTSVDISVSGALSVPTSGVPTASGTVVTDIALSGTLVSPTATIPTVSGIVGTDIAVSGVLSAPASTVASVSGTATTTVDLSGAATVPTATIALITGTATTTVELSGMVLDPSISLETAGPIERYAMLNNAVFYTDLIELIEDPASEFPEAPDVLVYAEIGNDGTPQGVYRPTLDDYEHFNGPVLFESTESPQTSTLGLYVHIDTRDAVDLINWGTLKIRQNGQSLVFYDNEEQITSLHVENGPLLLAVSITATDVTVQTPIYLQTVDYIVPDQPADILVGGTEYGVGRMHDVVAFGTAFDQATVLGFFDAALGRETIQRTVGSLSPTSADTSVTNAVWSNQ